MSPSWAQGPTERRRLRSRLLRRYPRAGWPSYLATALLGVLLAALLGVVFQLAGFEPVSNISRRPAYLLVEIFIRPVIETWITLSLPAFLLARLSRDAQFRYACLYLIVPVLAASRLPSGLYVASLTFVLGLAFAAVYIEADRQAGRRRTSPFAAAACTHGLYQLFSALLYFLLPQGA